MKVISMIGIATSLLVSACGGGSGDSDNDVSVLPRTDVRPIEALYPYRSDGPFADVLKPCALIASADMGCTLLQLPLVGQSGAIFSREDIMNRLLVTHDWMGQRFETLLAQAPDDMLKLFGSITSISIGSTIRPSNYWTATAGIRLDPRYLWMSVEEKATVSIEEDFRNSYGKDLEFWSLRASQIEGNPAYPFYSLTSYTERPLEDLKIPLYSLLYHELGHAVDYVHPDLMSLVNTSLNTANAIDELEWSRSSRLLTEESPLRSQAMEWLALVQFSGYIATEEQKRYTPADVGSFMAGDGAVKYYSYHTDREDFANLFESAMMKKNFNVNLLVGFVEKPLDEDNYSCSELIVGWGQHQRMSDPLVLPRAKWAMDRIYGPSTLNDMFFGSLAGLGRDMTAGVDWCQNRDGIFAALTEKNVFQDQVAGKLNGYLQLEEERRHRYH